MTDISLYVALRDLFANYLDPDILAQYDTFWTALLHYLSTAEAQAGDLLRGEIHHLLAQGWDDAQLRIFLTEELGAGYLPPAEEMSAAEFLAAVAEAAADPQAIH